MLVQLCVSGEVRWRVARAQRKLMILSPRSKRDGNVEWKQSPQMGYFKQCRNKFCHCCELVIFHNCVPVLVVLVGGGKFKPQVPDSIASSVCD